MKIKEPRAILWEPQATGLLLGNSLVHVFLVQTKIPIFAEINKIKKVNIEQQPKRLTHFNVSLNFFHEVILSKETNTAITVLAF